MRGMRVAEVIVDMTRSAVFVTILVVAGCVLSPDVHATAYRQRTPRRQPRPAPAIFDVPEATRLLVVAPHPDDEMLAAGGLMQRVLETGGTVRVVYLTDGDGYPEGVKQLDGHVGPPTAADFRGYGRRRRHEAEAAISRLGLDKSACTFLGFPDGGLCKLMRTYWSERRAAYR